MIKSIIMVLYEQSNYQLNHDETKAKNHALII